METRNSATEIELSAERDDRSQRRGMGGLYNDSIQVVAYIYAAGLIYTTCIRIAGVFRKTDIVYIQ